VTPVTNGPTRKLLVERRDRHGWHRTPDEVVVEEPLEIRLDDVLVATTMRTPGQDFELAAGFCHAEGWLEGTSVGTIRYCATGPALESDFNVVTVETGGTGPEPTPRVGTVTSSCGLCGSLAIDALLQRLTVLGASGRFALDVLVGVPERVRSSQVTFDRTGGLHAAAAFDQRGELLVVREDIGRHNAVDKAVGRLLLDGALPATGLGLFVSGRASFELVTKAWAAGFGVLVAVSAPSSLAVDAARQAGMTLVGFARGDELNVYSGSIER